MQIVPASPKPFYFVAGEASGDLLGAEVIAALRQAGCDRPVRATGGRALGTVADMSAIDISALSVRGLWDGVRAYGDVTRLAEATAQDILSFGPSHVVLVDSWGFCLRVARKVRAIDPSIRLIKLIGPQVWATRAGRAKTLSQTVDQLLCIHDFEVPYYEPFGLDTRVIGHPALSRSAPADGVAFRGAYGIAADDDVILVLPGSRVSEVDRVAPVFVDAARQLWLADKARRVVIAPAASIADVFGRSFRDVPEDWIVLDDEGDRFGAMAAADLALACSGTVTSEVAVQGTPLITGYKTGTVTWMLVKHVLMKADYITLLNMAAGRMVVPEFLQSALTATALAEHAEQLLGDELARASQIAAQHEALGKMGYGGRPAAALAAEILLEH